MQNSSYLLDASFLWFLSMQKQRGQRKRPWCTEAPWHSFLMPDHINNLSHPTIQQVVFPFYLHGHWNLRGYHLLKVTQLTSYGVGVWNWILKMVKFMIFPLQFSSFLQEPRPPTFSVSGKYHLWFIGPGSFDDFFRNFSQSSRSGTNVGLHAPHSALQWWRILLLFSVRKWKLSIHSINQFRPIQHIGTVFSLNENSWEFWWDRWPEHLPSREVVSISLPVTSHIN